MRPAIPGAVVVPLMAGKPLPGKPGGARLVRGTDDFSLAVGVQGEGNPGRQILP